MGNHPLTIYVNKEDKVERPVVVAIVFIRACVLSVCVRPMRAPRLYGDKHDEEERREGRESLQTISKLSNRNANILL
jgi:hypothetical protein